MPSGAALRARRSPRSPTLTAAVWTVASPTTRSPPRSSQAAPASEAISQAQALDLHTDVRSALDVPANTAETDLSTTGYVIDSLRCAVWAIQQHDTLESVLVALVNRGNDADTTAAIAGGLLGIIHGAEGIPQRWTQQLEYAPELVEAAAKIETIRDR